MGLNRMAVVKQLMLGKNAPRQVLEQFWREGEAIASFHHPNIMQIYDIGEHDGIPLISFEYVVGDNPLQRVGQSADTSVAMTVTISRAIHHAHERGINHRDLDWLAAKQCQK